MLLPGDQPRLLRHGRPAFQLAEERITPFLTARALLHETLSRLASRIKDRTSRYTIALSGSVLGGLQLLAVLGLPSSQALVGRRQVPREVGKPPGPLHKHVSRPLTLIQRDTEMVQGGVDFLLGFRERGLQLGKTKQQSGLKGILV